VQLKQFDHSEQCGTWYKYWKAFTVHPQLKIDYFETVDTKEKAYWLGFFFADGYLAEGERKGKPQAIGLKLNRKDEETIDRFCDALGLDKDRKFYRGDGTVGIVFGCKKMSADLMRQGVSIRKSKIIECPELVSRELELAFLLGFYDGDGTQNKTTISTGSKLFLDEVKNRFDLRYIIKETSGEFVICGKSTVATGYRMNLGPELFNEMMHNYTNSMTRKRRLLCDEEERIRRTVKACTPDKVRERLIELREWKAITREELRKLTREMPLSQISVKYSVSTNSVSKKCKKLSIPLPKRGYWFKLYCAQRYFEAKSKQNQ
jgi:hypothetical protein